MTETAVRVRLAAEGSRTSQIHIVGPLTSQAATDLASAIQTRILERDLFLHLVLTDVPYVNSAGMGNLIDLAIELDRRGGALFIVDVQAKVKLIFENLGILNYFRFATTIEEARLETSRLLDRTVRSPRVVLLPAGTEFPVVGTEIRIGSDPKSTIPIRHPQVEPRHAEIYRVGDQGFVRDLGTRFGTYVGDRKVNDEALKAGDVIRVGATRLVYFPSGGRT